MTQLPPWLLALQSRSPGESPGAHIARAVRGVAGCSLVHEPEKLAELFLVNEPNLDTARRVSTYATNCGTFSRCIACLGGCDHVLITCKYKVEMAVAWVLTAGREKGAIVSATRWREAGPGWIAHYATPTPKGGKPRNNDHIEIILTTPDAQGVADHGGGGRAKNAITIGTSDVRWSSGRPLLALIDPDLLLRPAPPYALATTRGVQVALTDLGFNPGPIDGVMGPATAAAVRGFQAAHGLAIDGKVGPMTRSALALALATS